MSHIRNTNTGLLGTNGWIFKKSRYSKHEHQQHILHQRNMATALRLLSDIQKSRLLKVLT